MKKIKRLSFLFILIFIFTNSSVFAQNSQETPLYKGKSDYTEFVNFLLRKVGDFESILDSSHNRCDFTILSFEISEKGLIENILFSKNYPKYLTDSITHVINLTNQDWQPAIVNGRRIMKKILQPILYQKGGATLDIYSLENIFNIDNNQKKEKYIDAIILPLYICEIIH
jgi:hypothetical protein